MAQQNHENHKLKLRVIFVGDSNVGKTCLFKLFKKHEVVKKTEVTIGIEMDIKSMVVGENHTTVQLLIHDTAGQEKHRSIVRQYYINADIALIVYDITNADSFHHVRQYWKKEVLDHSKNEDVKLILVGNKSDRNDERVVNSDDAGKYARNNGMSFIETSATNEDHFDILYDQIRTAAGQVLALGGSFFHRSEQSSGIQLDHNQEQPRGQPNRGGGSWWWPGNWC